MLKFLTLANIWVSHIEKGKTSWNKKVQSCSDNEIDVKEKVGFEWKK